MSSPSSVDTRELFDALRPDAEPSIKLNAIEKLSTSLLTNYGHLMIGNLYRLFTLLSSCLSKEQEPGIVHSCVKLVESIAKRGPQLLQEEAHYSRLLWPNLVALLGHERGVVRRSAAKALEAFASSNDTSAGLQATFIRHGIESEHDRIREEAARLSWKLFPVPGSSDQHGDVNSLMQCLARHCHDPSLVVSRAAASSLENLKAKISKGHAESAADENGLYAYHQAESGNSFADEKLSKDALVFGFIPSTVFDRTKHSNYRVRVGAVETIKDRLMSSIQRSNFDLHREGFLQFLLSIKGDSNFKIQLTCLEMVGQVIDQMGNNSVKPDVRRLIQDLSRIFGDSKVMIRQQNSLIFAKLINLVGFTEVAKPLLEIYSHHEDQVRGEILSVIAHALLSNRISERVLDRDKLASDLISIVSISAPARRERRIGIECLAILNRCMGSRLNDMLDEHMRNRLLRHEIEQRLRNPVLPSIDKDGHMLYPSPQMLERPATISDDVEPCSEDIKPQADSSQGSQEAGNTSTGTSRVARSSSATRRHPNAGSKSSRKIPFLNPPMAKTLATQNEQLSEVDDSSNQEKVKLWLRGANEKCEIDDESSPPSLFNGSSHRASRGRRSASASRMTHVSLPAAATDLTFTSVNASLESEETQSPGHSSSGGKSSERSDIASKLRTLKSKPRGRSPGRRAHSAQVRRQPSTEVLLSQTELAPAANTIGAGLSALDTYPLYNTLPVAEPIRRASTQRRQSRLAPSSAPSRRIADLEVVSPVELRLGSTAPEALKWSCGDPKADILACNKNLSSKDWSKQLEGLSIMRRLAENHPNQVRDQVKSFVLHLGGLLPNLRSSIARSALECTRALLRLHGADIDKAEIRILVPLLLKRAADAHGNEFLALEATRALRELSTGSLSIRNVLPILQGLARTVKSVGEKRSLCETIERCIRCIALKRGGNGAREMPQREVHGLLSLAADYLQEGSLEIRSSAKRLLRRLSSLPLFDDFLEEAKQAVSGSKVCSIESALGKSATLDADIREWDEQDTRDDSSVVEGAFVSPVKGTTVELSLDTAGGVLNSSNPQRKGGRLQRGYTQRARLSPASSIVELNSQLCVESASVVSNGAQGKEKHSSKSRNRAIVGELNKQVGDRLIEILTEMSANDWKQRARGIDKITEFIDTDRSVAAIKVVSIIDAFAPRFSDVNSKVNLLALQSIQHIIPKLKNTMNQTIGVLVPSISACLASSNSVIRQASSESLDVIMMNVDKTDAYSHLSMMATHGNSRLKAAVLTKLASLIASKKFDRASQVRKQVVPAAFALLKESKGDVQRANHALIRTIYKAVGPEAITDPLLLAKLNESSLKKLKDCLESC